MEGPHRPNSEEIKKDDKDQESIQSITQDTTWESGKNTIRHHKGQLYAWVSPEEPADQQHRHKTAYLVRPTLEYCTAVWSQHTERSKHKLEKVQRRAAMYHANKYHNTSSVTEMLGDLQ